MYDAATIALLEARIGFGSDAGISIDVDDALLSGTTDRTYFYFHKLVNIPNLYATTDEVNLPVADFEIFLQQLVTDSVKASLVAVMDQSVRNVPGDDYSLLIEQNANVFDEVVGYNLATSALEQMVSTTRVNDSQRNANATYTKLKVELNGLTDDNGHFKAQGINSKYKSAIRKARRVMFPRLPEIKSKKIW